MTMEETVTSGADKTVTRKEIIADGHKKAFRGKLDNDNFISYHFDDKKLVKKARFVIAEGEGWDAVPKRIWKRSMRIENREEWSISKDGKTLTQRVSGGNWPGIRPRSIHVYKRGS